MNTLIARQLRKPRGILGRYVFDRLEKFNVPVYEHAIRMLDARNGERIFEIGYGTGRMMNMLLGRYAGIEAAGIDFSKLMHRRAMRLNRVYIEAGRLKLHSGDIMTCGDGFSGFDTVFGLNVMYFCDMALVDRMYGIAGKNGKVVLYMNDPRELNRFGLEKMGVFNKYEIDEITDRMRRIGFGNVHAQVYSGEHETGYFLTGIK